PLKRRKSRGRFPVTYNTEKPSCSRDSPTARAAFICPPVPPATRTACFILIKGTLQVTQGRLLTFSLDGFHISGLDAQTGKDQAQGRHIGHHGGSPITDKGQV